MINLFNSITSGIQENCFYGKISSKKSFFSYFTKEESIVSSSTLQKNIEPSVNKASTLAKISLIAALAALPVIFYYRESFFSLNGQASHFTAPTINSLPDCSLTQSLDVIRSISGASFSKVVPSLSLTERFFSFTNFFTEGYVVDSLGFIKEAVLSKILYNTPAMTAYFDMAKSINFLPQTLFHCFFKGKGMLPNAGIELLTLADNLLPWDNFNQSMALPVRFSFDMRYLGAQSYSYGKALQTGIQYFAAREGSPLSFQKAAFLSLVGLQGMHTSLVRGHTLIQGFKLFSALDEVQQKSVLKHHALHEIGNTKPCNAVIIDGLSSSWGDESFLDDIPLPIAKSFYEKCNTLSYRVSSDEELCSVLNSAKEHFGAPFDSLSFLGHASENSMTLNKGYGFTDTVTRTAQKCIDRHVKSDGELFMLGCSTAAGDSSLTKHISESLPTRKVTGIKAYFGTYSGLQIFSSNPLSFKFFDLYSLKNIALSFRNGKEIT